MMTNMATSITSTNDSPPSWRNATTMWLATKIVDATSTFIKRIPWTHIYMGGLPLILEEPWASTINVNVRIILEDNSHW